MKVQGKFKMQAHINSGVVMDVAAFKVSHSVVSDIDATALRAARARSKSIGAMERYMSGFDSAQNSPSSANTHTANSEYTIGAMERYMRGFDSAQNSRSPATIHRQQ